MAVMNSTAHDEDNKRSQLGTGEMAEWLRKLVALQRAGFSSQHPFASSQSPLTPRYSVGAQSYTQTELNRRERETGETGHKVGRGTYGSACAEWEGEWGAT